MQIKSADFLSSADKILWVIPLYRLFGVTSAPAWNSVAFLFPRVEKNLQRDVFLIDEDSKSIDK